MSGFVLWLIYGLPWQFQALIILAIAGAVLCVIGMVFGWAVVRKIAAPVIGLVAVFIYARKVQQQGYNDRRAEEEKAADEAGDFADELRGDVQKLPPEKLDERFNRWEKK